MPLIQLVSNIITISFYRTASSKSLALDKKHFCFLINQTLELSHIENSLVST